MSKIHLIIEREYKTRVLKKSFILLTLLAPFLYVALIAVPIWLSSLDSDTQKNIVVLDATGRYQAAFPDADNYHFTYIDNYEGALDQKSLQACFPDEVGFLLITEPLEQSQSPRVTFYSDKQAQVETTAHLRHLLNSYVETRLLAPYDLPPIPKVSVQTIKWGEDGKETAGSSEVAMLIGMVAAMLIFMFISIYGAQVMSGVVQEKTNRIVEVLISSVRPFELMMGKVIGIALVGLTQVALWAVLTLVLAAIVLPLMGSAGSAELVNAATEQVVATSEQVATASSAMPLSQELQGLFDGINLPQIALLFLVYFLGGYLLYASLFAAVGSAVDNETDTNQFSLPLLIPIMFGFYAAIYAAQNPDGPLAFWCSLIPFTSPIVMMVRLPFDVAWWELLLSLVLLAATFLLTIYLAGRIYRTGILMYGKKPTWRELIKWAKHK